MRNWLYLLLFVPACGSGGGSGEVTIHSGRELAAAIEIDGVWQAIPPNADTTFSVEGPYSVTTVCQRDESLRVDIDTWLRTPEDTNDFWLPCGRDSSVAPIPVTVDASLGTDVRIGGHRLVTDDPTDYFAPGTWDVFAFTGDEYQIQRDVSITAPTTIDINAYGQWKPFETRTVTIDGTPADPGSLSIWLYLHSTQHVTYLPLETSTAPVLQVISPSDLEDEDRQLVSTVKLLADGGLSARSHVGDGPIDLVLPQEIAEAHGSYDDVPTASWRYDGVWTAASLTAWSSEGDSLQVSASSSWIVATGTTDTLVGVDVRAMPGFDAAWLPNATVGNVALYNADPDGPDTEVSKTVSSP